MSTGARVVHLRGQAGMAAIYRKAGWRSLPQLMLCCALLSFNRLGGAGLAVPAHEGAAWGLPLFLAGGALLAWPGTRLVEQWGARKALPLLLLCWGAAAAASTLASTPAQFPQFHIAQFALGACAAGVFPGVVVHLTRWFPVARRARAVALFASAPLVALLAAHRVGEAALQALRHAGVADAAQWLPALAGAAALLLALPMFACVDDHPREAAWLSPAEQQLIHQELEREQRLRQANAAPLAGTPSPALLRDPAFGLLALSLLMLCGAGALLLQWAPALLRRWQEQSQVAAAWLAMLPGAIGIAGMVLIGGDADRRQERRGHFVAAIVIACGGLALALAAEDRLTGALVSLTVALVGLAAALPLLLTILTEYLPPARTAGGIALAWGLGLAGAAAAPALAAPARDHLGDAGLPGLAILFCLASGAALLAALRLATRRRSALGRQGGAEQRSHYE